MSTTIGTGAENEGKVGYVFVEVKKLEEIKARAEAMQEFKNLFEESESRAKEMNFKKRVGEVIVSEIKAEAYKEVISMLIKEISHPIILGREERK